MDFDTYKEKFPTLKEVRILLKHVEIPKLIKRNAIFDYSLHGFKSEIEETEIEILTDSHPMSQVKDEFQTEKCEFKCVVCQKSFTSLSKLNTHEETYVLSSYECNVCVEMFSTIGDLKTHKLTHVKEKSKSLDDDKPDFAILNEKDFCFPEESFKCNLCDKSFSIEASLQKHLLYHNSPYKCTICDEGFQLNCDLIIHEIIHSRQNRFQCENCKENFPVLYYLRKHQDTCDKKFPNPNKKPFKCRICKMRFSQKTFYKKHLLYHDKSSRYPCKLCNKKFKLKNIYAEHLRRVHTHEKPVKPFQCYICEKSYVYQSQLNGHLKSHYEEKHKCSFCSKLLVTKNSLEQHLKCHTEGDFYKCQICELLFENLSFLKTHEKSHRAELKCCVVGCDRKFENDQRLIDHSHFHKLKKSFECDICSNKFYKKYDLQRHLYRIHKKGKAYECNFCARFFLEKSEFNLHNKVHNGKQQFKCPICPMISSANANLNIHLSYHRDTYSCSQCEENFKGGRLFADHLKTHEDLISTFDCNVCGRKFSSSGDFTFHLSFDCGKPEIEESKISKILFNCPICPKSLASEINLQRHLSNHKETYFCAQCDQYFTCGRSLSYHMKSHEEISSFNCDYCKTTCSSSEALDQHKKLHSDKSEIEVSEIAISTSLNQSYRIKSETFKIETQSKEDKFKCNFWEMEYADKQELEDHLKIHNGRKQHKCKVCGILFKSNFNFLKHQKTHRKEIIQEIECSKISENNDGLHDQIPELEKRFKFKCHICDARFDKETSLVGHLHRHKAGKRLKCDFCEKLFSFKQELITHRRIHTGEKPFECTICPKKYKCVGELNIHLKSHKETYSCSHCGEAFLGGRLLSDHLKTHVQMKKETPEIKIQSNGSTTTDNFIPNQKIKNEEIVEEMTIIYSCNNCPVQFVSQSQIDEHTRSCKYL